MARDEVWDALKNHAKQVHSERVAKNPDRIAYAIQQFEAHGIEYQLKFGPCWKKWWAIVCTAATNLAKPSS